MVRAPAPSASPAPRHVRRSHAERSHATQQDLITATIQVIAERGLENASTFEIAKLAGVTPGALQHHFANKKALILRAATELVHSDDLGGHLAVWPDLALPLRQRAHEAINTAWNLTYGRPNYVTMWSIFMACRTDPELLHHMADEREALRVRMASGFLRAFPELDALPDPQSVANLIFSALRGMGVQEMFAPPAQLCAGQRAVLVELLVQHCEQAPAPARPIPAPASKTARKTRALVASGKARSKV
jgi:AcrR family transcriptional regulator